MSANNITLIIQNRTVPKISLNPQPSNEWGKIGGLLSNQLDLWNALLGKADASHTHTFAQITSKPTTLAGYGITDAASLDVSGKVPSSQLPSYVDDVLEFANAAAFPVTGESGKIYIALDTNIQYRWTGSTYIQITSSSAVWGNISGLLGNQSDLVAALASKYDASNPSGFITSSALAPYLLTTTAASTYQPIGTYATPSNTMTFSNKSGDISQWTNDVGYITSSALTPYLLSSTASTTYAPISHGHTWAQITSTPTTLAGYGITDPVALTTGTLAQFAATTSAQLFGLLSDKTGTGLLVFNTSPTFTTGIQINAGTNSGRAFELFQDTASVKIGSNPTTGSIGAIWFGIATPSNTNYNIQGDSTFTTLNTSAATGTVNISLGGTTTATFRGLVTSGANTTFTFTKPNNTGQTASTPIVGYLFNTGTRQWATGAISGTQVEVDITSPTYYFVAASTIAEAATLRVTAATAGTFATITNNFAGIFNAGSASVKIGNRTGVTDQAAIYLNQTTPNATNYALSVTASGGTITTLNGSSALRLRLSNTDFITIDSTTYTFNLNNVGTGAVTSYTFNKPNNTNQTAGANIAGFLFTTGSRQWATGAVTLQEEFRITAPTYSFVAASTMTNASTLSVYAPIAGTNATITNAWAIRAHGNVQLATNNAGLFGLDSTATSRQLLTFTGDNIRIYGRPGVSDIYLDPTASSNNGVYIKSSGSVGFGVATPTAWLHLRAGSAGTSSAPLKFTSGTNQTTAESGTIEYNGRFFMTESDNIRRSVLLAASATKTTAAAPYTNDGFIEVQINGSNVKLMTTA